MNRELDGRNPADPTEESEDGRRKGVGEQDRSQGVRIATVPEPDPAQGLGPLARPGAGQVRAYPHVDPALYVQFDSLLQAGPLGAVLRRGHVGRVDHQLVGVSGGAAQVAE
jgi:hypothetical protein